MRLPFRDAVAVPSLLVLRFEHHVFDAVAYAYQASDTVDHVLKDFLRAGALGEADDGAAFSF